jgi:hypothetical protein
MSIRIPRPKIVRLRLPAALTVAATLAIAAPSALADTASSSNWAGYAVHRAGTRFTSVSGAWRQPTATCRTGRRTYSALWVGLGGFNGSSNSLEQIGSEVDCTASGQVSSSAWYELVPAPSRPIRMRVRPGDELLAGVTVTGNRVAMVLDDVSTRHSFRKTFQMSAPDVSSADWILEAPSECVSQSVCQTLPLANFGSATFNWAKVQAVGGHTGTISDPFWDETQIKLTPGGRRFVVNNGAGPTAGAAVPSPLTANGTSFKVKFSTVTVQSNPFFIRRSAALRAGYLVHPGR